MGRVASTEYKVWVLVDPGLVAKHPPACLAGQK